MPSVCCKGEGSVFDGGDGDRGPPCARSFSARESVVGVSLYAYVRCCIYMWCMWNILGGIRGL